MQSAAADGTYVHSMAERQTRQTFTVMAGEQRK